jgi:hypothetical protein
MEGFQRVRTWWTESLFRGRDGRGSRVERVGFVWERGKISTP